METQNSRYKRQIMLQNWGENGQKRLREARVLIAGAGGLGSPVALYLAAAGVGSMTICDMDCVDWSNLNRQILHTPQRIGLNKAVSAAQTLSQFNQDIAVRTVTEKIEEGNVEELVGQSDIVVDCLDNFETRYLLMEKAALHQVPYVYASVWGMEGRLTFFSPPDTPCLQCVFPESPAKEEIPIVGATAGVIGSLQALEVIKYLNGTGPVYCGRMLIWDGSINEFYTVKLHKKEGCPICGRCRAPSSKGRRKENGKPN